MRKVMMAKNTSGPDFQQRFVYAEVYESVDIYKWFWLSNILKQLLYNFIRNSWVIKTFS